MQLLVNFEYTNSCYILCKFGVPGAFTPVCSEKHLPEYVMKERELRTKSVDEVICLTVNDFFVVKEWAKVTGVNRSGFCELVYF